MKRAREWRKGPVSSTRIQALLTVLRYTATEYYRPPALLYTRPSLSGAPLPRRPKPSSWGPIISSGIRARDTNTKCITLPIVVISFKSIHILRFYPPHTTTYNNRRRSSVGEKKKKKQGGRRRREGRTTGDVMRCDESVRSFPMHTHWGVGEMCRMWVVYLAAKISPLSSTVNVIPKYIIVEFSWLAQKASRKHLPPPQQRIHQTTFSESHPNYSPRGVL